MTNTIYDAAEKYLIAANEFERAERDLRFMRKCMESAEEELLSRLMEEDTFTGDLTIDVGRSYGLQVNDLGSITAFVKKVELLHVSKPVNLEPHYKDLELDLS